MVLTPGTIHDVLARRNPALDVKTKKGSNTRDPDYVQVEKRCLRPWREFDYQHLVRGWGHVLAIEGARGRFEEEISDSQKEILDEDKIDSVAELWNVECLRDPLKKGAAFIRGASHPDITIKKKYMQYPRKNRAKSLEPDMAIFLKDGNRTSSTTLVMGDNKCATKWNHRDMADPDKPRDTMWPVRQITTYCEAAKTRYGWIMTTSEVVVFRVSKNPSSSDQAKYIIEWNFVPWTSSGEGTLTVNLAIWWLGMMGLADRHREIVLPPRMYPINLWQKWKAKDGTDRYTHMLSQRTLAALPPGERHIAAN